jgi:hypothetical protein
MQLPAAATYLAKIRGHRRHHLGVAQKHPAIFVYFRLLPQCVIRRGEMMWQEK